MTHTIDGRTYTIATHAAPDGGYYAIITDEHGKQVYRTREKNTGEEALTIAECYMKAGQEWGMNTIPARYLFASGRIGGRHA